MNEVAKIIAPTNNVNDTSVTVYQFLVKDGVAVKTGDAVLVIETSKTTVTIESPVDGFIRFKVKIGDEVPNGGLLAVIVSRKEMLDREVSDVMPIEEMPSVKPRVSGETVQSTSIPEVPFGVFDRPVTLCENYVKNGEKVDKGDVLCQIRENSGMKNVVAPETGYVHWRIEPYHPASAGQALGSIGGSPVPGDVNEVSPVSYTSLRVSQKAAVLLQARKLSAADLGLTGLVTEEIVRKKLKPIRKIDTFLGPQVFPEAVSSTVHVSEGRYERLSRSKISESSFLVQANHDAVISQVSVLVPTHGIFSAGAEDSKLAGKFSSLILYETARLLRQYRRMLSVYDQGRLFIYDHINIGYALSIDDGLKVPVIRDADQKDLDNIQAEKELLVEKYISQELTPEDLSDGTFTITDLSSSGCYLFNPVLNLGQSAILGIGGENTEGTNYPLILAYDHRVIDGMTASEFLRQLRQRLIAHENVLLAKFGIMKETTVAMRPENPDDAEDPVCDICFRSAKELNARGLFLIRTIEAHGKEKHVCSLCLAGY